MDIDEKRLKRRMDEINSIAVTAEGGIMRLALTDADRQARDLLRSWMGEEGMEAAIDDMGTLYGIVPGTDPEALPICAGSHMDTQPNGGRFDGLFGVMAALEAVSTLRDQNIRTKSPLMLIDWTNEEGARFVPPMLASGVAAGHYEAGFVNSLRDRDGLRYEDELRRIGYLGEKKNRLTRAKFYVEPHIEQGPVLDAEGLQLGIVTGALGICGLDVTVKGRANHAGTTPMSHRNDPMAAAAAVITAIQEHTLSLGDPAVLTVGIIEARPASKNIIPQEVYFSVDMRSDTPQGLTQLERNVRHIIETVCRSAGVQVDIQQYWKSDPVQFDRRVIAAAEAAGDKLGLTSRRLTSGAGHDAVFISDIIPTGMIFIPSIQGMSHCPQEQTSWEDVITGTKALLEILLQLDEQPGSAAF